MTIAHLAAAYASGLAWNHPFLDGNKRIAFVISLLFLRLNDYRIEATDDEKYATLMALAEGILNAKGLAKWLYHNCSNMITVSADCRDSA